MFYIVYKATESLMVMGGGKGKHYTRPSPVGYVIVQ